MSLPVISTLCSFVIFPGKGYSLQFLTSRTRLQITLEPSFSGTSNHFSILVCFLLQSPDLIPEPCGLLVILPPDRVFKL